MGLHKERYEEHLGSTPGARRSAVDLFVASVAPITDAKSSTF